MAKPATSNCMEQGRYQASTYTVQPRADHIHTCILLHGRGSNGHLFGSRLLDAKTSSGKTLSECFPNMKFIFPTAKGRRSTALNRIKINQWFDIYSLEDPSEREHLQVEGLEETANVVHSMIREELGSIKAENIFIGGLSQGCAASLHAMLTFGLTLGGYIGMSGWLPFQGTIQKVLEPLAGDTEDIEFEFEFESEDQIQNKSDDCASREQANASVNAVNYLRQNLSMCPLDREEPESLETPVFLGHGEKDPKVNYTLGEDIRSTLELMGMDVTWKVYKDFGHWYKVPEELDDIVAFLADKFRPQTET